MNKRSFLDSDALLYFNHIPKTAGTSLRNSLERLFPHSLCNKYWFADNYLSDRAANLDTYRLLSGHFGMIPPLLNGKRHQMLVFLREPIERIFSHYLHIKSDENSPWRAITDGLSFEDFLFSPVAEGELLNFQARHLGFTSISDYFEIKDRMLDSSYIIDKCRTLSILDEAKANLDRSWFVGVSNHFERSVHRLSHKLGVPLDSEAKLNMARIKSVMPDLSASARSRLEWLTEFDQELYEMALSRYAEVSEEESEPFTPNTSFFKTHIDFTDGFVGGGWHPAESRDDKGYCWSFTNAPWVAFTVPWRWPSMLTARIATWIPDDITSLVLTANGEEIPFYLASATHGGDGNFMYLHAKIPSDLAGPSGMLRICFNVPRTIQPSVISGRADERELGLYANWIRLLPAGGYKSL